MQIFTLGGSFSGALNQDKGGEVFNPSTNGPWTETTGIQGSVINSDDPQGMFRIDNYGFFFAWTGNSGAITTFRYPAPKTFVKFFFPVNKHAHPTPSVVACALIVGSCH